MENKTANVSLNSVSKLLGDFQLNNVNFEAFSKDIIGIIGENGAGKTTFLKILSHDIYADSGEVTAPFKDQIGFVFDSNHLPGELNAKELNKIFRSVFYKWNSNMFFNYLSTLKIPTNLPIKNLSKGMKMKTNIAVALSHNPTYLLLDEITSGLDPLVRNNILYIIKDYVEKNEAIAIMTTHLLDDVVRISNKVIVLHEGTVVLDKNVNEIKDTNNLESLLTEVVGE